MQNRDRSSVAFTEHNNTASATDRPHSNGLTQLSVKIMWLGFIKYLIMFELFEVDEPNYRL